MDVNYGDAYLKCVNTFNNVLNKLREDISNEIDLADEAKNDAEKAQHYMEKALLIGKYLMLDQVICFMFREAGFEVEKDDIRDRFKRDK